MFLIQIRTFILPFLNWVQTICKVYQQMTKVADQEIQERVSDQGSYMSAHEIHEFIKPFGEKRKNSRPCQEFYLFFAISLINYIIQGHGV